jgi:hypothetical protein
MRYFAQILGRPVGFFRIVEMLGAANALLLTHLTLQPSLNPLTLMGSHSPYLKMKVGL